MDLTWYKVSYIRMVIVSSLTERSLHNHFVALFK
jgi:hypothetical protein